MSSLLKYRKSHCSYIYIAKYTSQKEILQAKWCWVAYAYHAQRHQHWEETAEQIATAQYNALNLF